MIKDNIIFLKEFFNEFRSTGSFCPNSKWAAKAMTIPIASRRETSPLRILELGPGTGSVTTKILEQMTVRDELAICEINPRLMRALKVKLARNPFYILHQERIRFFECAAQEMPEDDKYDVIVCALPFLNFDLVTVEEIFAKLRSVSTEETVMTYYEYIGLRTIGLMMSPPKRKARIKQLDRFFDGVFENHLSQHEQVWANMLPINVYMLKNLESLPMAV